MQPNQFQALGWGWGGQGQPGLRRGAGGAAPLGLRGVRPLRQPGAHRRSSASLHTRFTLAKGPRESSSTKSQSTFTHEWCCGRWS